jgi:hypothetical protein
VDGKGCADADVCELNTVSSDIDGPGCFECIASDDNPGYLFDWNEVDEDVPSSPRASVLKEA